ncbi:MAG: hypothetical protein PHH37_12890 [Paludibacter sp.]|nr:hypothetical protein [Paludibacter sp.]
MKKIIYTIFILAFALSSCDNNEIQISNSNKWVNLESNEQLMSLLDQIDEGKDITNVLPSTNFVSLWDIYETICTSEEAKQKELMEKYPFAVKITDDESGKEVKLNLNDKALAKLLTADGFIKIGTRIIKVEGDVFKEISNGDEALIPTLSNVSESNPDLHIVVKKIISYQVMTESNDNRQKMIETWAYWNGYEYYNSTTRCNWNKWIDYNAVFNYTDVGAEVTNQHKGWLGWVNWFSSSSYMYLHLYSEYLYCPNFEYDKWSELMGDTPRLDLTKSGTTNNIRVNKRFSNTDTPSAGHVQIDFIYRGTSYEH